MHVPVAQSIVAVLTARFSGWATSLGKRLRMGALYNPPATDRVLSCSAVVRLALRDWDDGYLALGIDVLEV